MISERGTLRQQMGSVCFENIPFEIVFSVPDQGRSFLPPVEVGVMLEFVSDIWLGYTYQAGLRQSLPLLPLVIRFICVATSMPHVVDGIHELSEQGCMDIDMLSLKEGSEAPYNGIWSKIGRIADIRDLALISSDWTLQIRESVPRFLQSSLVAEIGRVGGHPFATYEWRPSADDAVGCDRQ
jgi:hypothetical protein